MYSWAEITGGIKGRRRSLSIRELGRRGRVWQTESFDRVLRSSESLDAKLAYILDNPVRGGLVSECGDYVWTRSRVEHPHAVAQPPGCARRAAEAAVDAWSVTPDPPVSASAPLRPSTTHQTASG
jgi:hypothetical protein